MHQFSLQNIKPHLTTSNLYLQKEIVKKNIDYVNQHTSHHAFSSLVFELRRDILKVKDQQVNLLANINIQIKKHEQLYFKFDLPLD